MLCSETRQPFRLYSEAKHVIPVCYKAIFYNMRMQLFAASILVGVLKDLYTDGYTIDKIKQDLLVSKDMEKVARLLQHHDFISKTMLAKYGKTNTITVGGMVLRTFIKHLTNFYEFRTESEQPSTN